MLLPLYLSLIHIFIETLGITVSSASFRDIFAFIFLILMLLIRPEGFASKKGARP